MSVVRAGEQSQDSCGSVPGLAVGCFSWRLSLGVCLWPQVAGGWGWMFNTELEARCRWRWATSWEHLRARSLGSKEDGVREAVTQPGRPSSWLPHPLAQARTEAQILGGDCSHLPSSSFGGRMAEGTSHRLSTNYFQLENATLTDTQRGCLVQSDFPGGRQGTSQRWLRGTWRAGHRGQQSNVEPVAKGPPVSPQGQCRHHHLHRRRHPPLVPQRLSSMEAHRSLSPKSPLESTKTAASFLTCSRRQTLASGHHPLKAQWAKARTCP